MPGDINGAELLITEIDEELSKKRLPRRDRLLLKSQKYILEGMSPLRKSVSDLEKHDVMGWSQKHPKSAILLIILLAFINSMVNWTSLRRPLLQAIAQQLLGISIPLEEIP